MDVLNDEQEFGLLKYMYPDANVDSLLAIAEIAHHTREVSRGDVGKLSTMISTRLSIEAAGLVYDGFSLLEACEIAFFPFFPADGGIDSERTYMKQLVQKWVKDESTDDELFSEADTVKSDETVW
jgi:hypothetical protein